MNPKIKDPDKKERAKKLAIKREIYGCSRGGQSEFLTELQVASSGDPIVDRYALGVGSRSVYSVSGGDSLGNALEGEYTRRAVLEQSVNGFRSFVVETKGEIRIQSFGADGSRSPALPVPRL